MFALSACLLRIFAQVFEPVHTFCNCFLTFHEQFSVFFTLRVHDWFLVIWRACRSTGDSKALGSEREIKTGHETQKSIPNPGNSATHYARYAFKHRKHTIYIYIYIHYIHIKRSDAFSCSCTLTLLLNFSVPLLFATWDMPAFFSWNKKRRLKVIELNFDGCWTCFCRSF